MSDSPPRFDENPPPGKYGKMTVLPHAGPGHLTPEEMALPLTDPVRRVRSHFLADTTIPGNFTPEELNCPLVDTGCRIITPSSAEPPPPAEADIGPIAKELGELFDRTPPAERGRLAQRLQGLLVRMSAGEREVA